MKTAETLARSPAFPLASFFSPVRLVPASNYPRRVIVQASIGGAAAVSDSPDALTRPPGASSFVLSAQVTTFELAPRQALYAARFGGIAAVINISALIADGAVAA